MPDSGQLHVLQLGVSFVDFPGVQLQHRELGSSCKQAGDTLVYFSMFLRIVHEYRLAKGFGTKTQ